MNDTPTSQTTTWDRECVVCAAKWSEAAEGNRCPECESVQPPAKLQTTEATCKNRGHMRGPGEECVMCGEPMPTDKAATIRVLLLESYCENNIDCTDALPCRDCIGLCDTATITGPVSPDLGCFDHQRMEQYDNARK